MDEHPKVGIIIPVYNTQEYIRRCVDSALAQTMREIEIVIVDDGSTDDSGAISDEYAACDSRIRVLHKENAGLSEARNDGIAACSADYLMFLDSDDCVDPRF